jgi:lysyl-tRNA synthetase class 2
LGQEAYEQFHTLVDIGDFVGAKGEMFTTKTGEKTLQASQYQFLGKCFRPLPEKWHGLTDVETRYRQRYLDLVMNAETRNRFLLRSKLVSEMRSFLEKRNFIEVETATLQANPSGALARPFITHHNTLDIDLYLRIAPETYLKRLIVGGFTNIFEFARCFRNEGISPQHLQEFTMVEGYSAYWNYEDNMKLIRDMFLHLIEKCFGTLVVKIGEQEVDFGRDWPRVTFRELILKDCGIDIDEYKTTAELLKVIRSKRIELEHEEPEVLSRGNLIDLLYKRVSRPKIVQPTFLVAHPIDLSPLARANDQNPDLTDRFQLIVNGAEIVNAYSELVDPIEQRKRLEEQAARHSEGDEDAMVKDDDYVTAMEYGMPPISGWGLGIERLIQFLTNCDNIKDCVLFPTSRPKND